MDIWVVCYDIKNGDRRNDVSELLKDYEGFRVQDSVFELEMDEIKKLIEKIEELIYPSEDKVDIYQAKKICHLGQKR